MIWQGQFRQVSDMIDLNLERSTDRLLIFANSHWNSDRSHDQKTQPLRI